PQQIADLVVERGHGLFAVAPGGHAEFQALEKLLAVLLRRDGREPSRLEIARGRGLVIDMAIRHIHADITLPVADQGGQRPQFLWPQYFAHYCSSFRTFHASE